MNIRQPVTRVVFCVEYFAFWLLFHILLRIVFIAYHHTEASRSGLRTIAGSVLHGSRMDLSAAAFPCFLVFLLAALSLFSPRIPGRIIIWVSMALLVLESLLVAIDLELYRAWGFRADAQILRYFITPREMFASIGSSPIVLLAMVFVLLAACSTWAFTRWLVPRIRAWEAMPFPWSLVAIPLAPVLIYSLYGPVRGGYQAQPMKQSTVFFSQDAFANQAALNVTWNFLDGAWNRIYSAHNPYQYLAAAEASRVTDSLLRPADGPSARLLRVARPNVIVIIWESWTSKVVARLGGRPGVTPNIDSLIHDGVLFTHFYATGDRSPKGLTGIISGYPSQPTTEIINQPRKSASLPALPKDLAKAGYVSRFYYGGDPDFSNFKAFALSAGFDSLITERDFDPASRHSTWGADDHVVLARALADMRQIRTPFFVTLFTLSSHEPFIVPMTTVIAGTDEESKFLNSHAYTDRSIGDFVRAARRETWWDSTLIIVVADHGHRLPVLDSLQTSRKWETFSIPMLWLGGALATRDTVIDTPGGQTDVAATLLHQLGLDATAYAWSKDLLAPRHPAWAWFSFNDGFGFVNAAGGAVAWDNIGRRVIAIAGNTGAGDIRTGQAILQRLIDDYVKR